MNSDRGVGAAEVIARMHAGDPIAQSLGIELVEGSDERVVLRMPIDDRHVGGASVCHGGILFTFADVAMSYYGNRSNEYAVATQASIDFIEAVHGGVVIEAEAAEAHLRGRAAVYDVTLRVEGRVVALFRGKTLRIQGRVTDIY